MKIYLIGALTNRGGIYQVSARLREEGWDVFDDWLSPGEEADQKWQEYELNRGRSYLEALRGHHARHVFSFDFKHLNEADVVVMVAPCGRSGHLELGWAIGRGKFSYVLFREEPDRYDIMYLLAHEVFFDLDYLIEKLRTVVGEAVKNGTRLST